MPIQNTSKGVSPRRIIWQLGSGPDGREFAQTFLENDVALLGPGDLGPWDEPRYREKTLPGDWRALRAFYNDVRGGDLVLMRKGKTTAIAIGVFSDDPPKFNELFDDVAGWDLQHTRRVVWSRFWERIPVLQNAFGGRPSRFGRVHREEVREIAMAEYAKVAEELAGRIPRELAAAEPKIEPPTDLRDYLNELAEYYAAVYSFYAQISEHEVVCHAVVPLLRSLGWRNDQMALEWKPPESNTRVDVAIFAEESRWKEGATPAVLIEVKRPQVAFETAYDQAYKYAKSAGCQGIFLTDGFCWRQCGISSGQWISRAKMLRFTQEAQQLVNALRP